LFPFGIRVIIIEPGVIKTNFFHNCIVSEKSSKKNSSYSNLLKKIQKNIELMQEHATPPVEVAKVILQALKTDEPKQRYVVGNDAAMILEAKKTLSDIEFKKMMMQNIIWLPALTLQVMHNWRISYFYSISNIIRNGVKKSVQFNWINC